jgi:hypothetical protein
MASYNPFAKFRENQKTYLAIVGVMAMVSFIILPIVLQLLDVTQTSGQGRIATCRRFNTKIDDVMLDNLRRGREALSIFYRQLYARMSQLPNIQQTDIFITYQIAAQFENRLSGEQLIQNWLVCRYAEEQGIVVSGDMVVNYLREITRSRITKSLLSDVLHDIGLEYKQIESLIKEELLRNNIVNSEMAVAEVYPPTLRWDWFQRMNRQVTAEVAAIPVSAFASPVADPSNSTLEKFFEDNKYAVYNPESPNSGFSSPLRLNIQYLVSKVEQKTLDSITQEEIEKYYNDNKETLYRKQLRPLTLPNGQPNPANSLFGTGGGTFLPGSNPSFGGGAASRGNIPTFPLLPQPNVPQGVSEQPKEETPTTETPDAAAPSVQPLEQQNVDEKPVEENVDEKPKESSSLKSDSVYRQVAFQAEEKPADVKPAEEKPADVKPAEEKPADVKPAEEKPADVKPAEDKPADVKPAEDKPVDVKLADDKPADAIDDKPIDLSILYSPLSEVEASIRQTLAIKKNQDRVEGARVRMQAYFQEYNKALGSNKDLPAAPNLTEYANEFGLELIETTSPVTLHEALTLPFARDRSALNVLFQIYDTSPVPFMPEVIQGENAVYVLWITKEEKQFVPKFADVRDTVLARWKEVEARPAAKKAAEKIVEQAKTSKQSLADLFKSQSEIKDYKVVETEAFAWKTYGNATETMEAQMYGVPPRIGEVREKGVAEGTALFDNTAIKMAGTDFMRAAYSLQIGETGYALDQSETVVYLIRCIGSTPSDDVLLEKFHNARLSDYAQAGMSEYRYSIYQSWLKQIESECDFKWIRKPNEQE